MPESLTENQVSEVIKLLEIPLNSQDAREQIAVLIHRRLFSERNATVKRMKVAFKLLRETKEGGCEESENKGWIATLNDQLAVVFKEMDLLLEKGCSSYTAKANSLRIAKTCYERYMLENEITQESEVSDMSIEDAQIGFFLITNTS